MRLKITDIKFKSINFYKTLNTNAGRKNFDKAVQGVKMIYCLWHKHAFQFMNN